MKATMVIAGGTSGIGREAQLLLTERGSDVVCAGRDPDKLSLDPSVRAVRFDATDADAELDLPDVIHGAAYFPGTITLKPFHGLKSSDFQRDLEINFLGATRFLQAALPGLKNGAAQRGGYASVVLFSTVAVQTGLPFHASIAAAKGAVEGLTRSLAAEWAPHIRVNAIAPSLTDTPLAARLLDSEKKAEAARERHPLKQTGEPIDIAKLAVYLLSEDSRFVTGQVFKIDGGLSSIKN